MKKRPGLFISLSVDIDSHPAMVGLSDSAFRLFIDLICHCQRHRTDGHVNSATVAKLYAPKVLDELLRAGVVTRADVGSGYYLPAYLDWHKSKAEIDNLSATRRQVAQQREDKRRANEAQVVAQPAHRVPADNRLQITDETSGFDLGSNQGGATVTPLTGISNVNGGVA